MKESTAVRALQGILATVMVLAFLALQANVTDSRIAIVVMMGALCLALISEIVNSLRMSWGAGSHAVRDVSANAPPAPHAMTRHLQDLGFHYVGTTLTDVPGFQDTYVWHFVSSDHTVMAEMVTLDDTVLIKFNSYFGEQAVVETSYPVGDTVETATRHAHRNTESPQAAYEDHILHMMDFYLPYGNPQPITTMQQILDWDAIYRQHHFRKGPNPIIIANIITGSTIVFVIVTFLLSVFVPEMQSQMQTLGCIAMPIIFLSAGYQVWLGRKSGF